MTLEAPFPTVERSWKAAPDLSDEMRLIAQTIADELACGTDPHTIAVVGTNRTWRTNLQRALASVGIPSSAAGPSLFLALWASSLPPARRTASAF